VFACARRNLGRASDRGPGPPDGSQHSATRLSFTSHLGVDVATVSLPPLRRRRPQACLGGARLPPTPVLKAPCRLWDGLTLLATVPDTLQSEISLMVKHRLCFEAIGADRTEPVVVSASCCSRIPRAPRLGSAFGGRTRSGRMVRSSFDAVHAQPVRGDARRQPRLLGSSTDDIYGDFNSPRARVSDHSFARDIESLMQTFLPTNSEGKFFRHRIAAREGGPALIKRRRLDPLLPGRSTTQLEPDRPSRRGGPSRTSP